MLPACDGRIDAEHAAPWLPAGTNASEQAPSRTNAEQRIAWKSVFTRLRVVVPQQLQQYNRGKINATSNWGYLLITSNSDQRHGDRACSLTQLASAAPPAEHTADSNPIVRVQSTGRAINTRGHTNIDYMYMIVRTWLYVHVRVHAIESNPSHFTCTCTCTSKFVLPKSIVF